jgi:hypothetical protein
MGRKIADHLVANHMKPTRWPMFGAISRRLVTGGALLLAAGVSCASITNALGPCSGPGT